MTEPSCRCHGRFETQSRRKAQRHKLAAAAVRRRYSGSVARCHPSAKNRKRCAKVISPKTAPVVMIYAFIESPPLVVGHGVRKHCAQPKNAACRVVGMRLKPHHYFRLAFCQCWRDRVDLVEEVTRLIRVKLLCRDLRPINQNVEVTFLPLIAPISANQNDWSVGVNSHLIGEPATIAPVTPLAVLVVPGLAVLR